MPLMTAMTVVAVAYVATSRRETDPAFDMEGKTPVELLPVEKELAIFEMPISSITFFDGDPDTVVDFLKMRVAEIISANPWLGGWVHLSKGSLQLWYDKTGKDLAPNLFRAFKVGELQLERDSFLKEPHNPHFQQLFVKKTHELTGKNEPIWRLSLVPDAAKPKERFSLVMSFSHVGGDTHTFYQLYKMISSDQPVLELNPVRSQDFPRDVKALMGEKEAEYIFTARDKPLQKVVHTKACCGHYFYISEDWVQMQKLMYSNKLQGKLGAWVDNSKLKAAANAESCSCWGLCDPSKPVATNRNQNGRAKLISHKRLSQNDVVTCWFWKSLSPQLGFMPYNHRNRLSCLTELDAGNYNSPIVYTPSDYKTPQMIQQSLQNARRIGADSVLARSRLPLWTWDTSYSFSLNWLSLSRGMNLVLGADVSQVLHMPFFNENDLSVLPSSSSFINLFAAGPNRVGVHVHGTEAVMSVIESSGIVKETIAKYGF